MRDLAGLTAADFDCAAGSVFEVLDPGLEPLAIRLDAVVRFQERPGHRQPFSLRFAGPQAPVLAHTMHRIRHEDMGDLEIFLGPVVSDSSGTTYEAVFT
jgi:hypothetical protein